MKIFLIDQKADFQKHLERLKNYAPIPYAQEVLNHKVSSEKIHKLSNSIVPSSKGLFNYNIFPSNILQAYPQWIDENREIRVGDTIVQQIQIPPFHKFSIKVIVGVRIKEIFNSEALKGFSYETLQGHLEKGISIFKIEIRKTDFIFSIETYSNPATFFLKLFRPISLLYQEYCTEKALKYVTHYYSTEALFLNQK